MQIVDINGEKRICTKIVPDPNYAGFMKVNYESKIRKGYSHSEWYPISDFIKNNPTLANLTQKAPKAVEETLGRVSQAKEDSLSDSKANWKENVYKDFPIWISRGKGEGQTRTIVRNTKNILYIKPNWDVIPDRSSQYVVSKNVHDPQVMGNILPPEVPEIKEKLTKRKNKAKLKK